MVRAVAQKAEQPADVGPWRVEVWPADRLVPYARNPRKNDHAVDRMAGSIREFGFKIPILARSDGTIVDGHLRLKAAQKLSISEVPVLLCDEWTDAQVKAFRLMVNRSVGWADWDTELLSLEMADLAAADFDLAFTGFDPEEIANITADRTAGNTDPDEVPDIPDDPVTAVGDLWLLGRHRLLCGDATSIDSIEKLLAGDNARMVFTDPPYGISIVKCDGSSIGGGEAVRGGQTKGWVGGGAKYKIPFRGSRGRVPGPAKKAIIKPGVYAPIIGDETTQTAIDAYNLCAGLDIETLIFWGGNYYAHALPPSRCWIVWDKENTGTFADCELAWTNMDRPARLFRHMWNGLMKASERGQSRIHPTQKPIALAAWAFEQFGDKEDRVLDLFLGSGSSLIACEQTSRSCYGVELAEAYCDASVVRWQNFTGKQATLDEDGRTFAEVKDARA